MPDDDYTPFGDHPPTPELTALRLHAEQLCKTESDEELLGLVEELRDDRQLWPHFWAPAVAVAASRTGRPDALDLLRDAVEAGFSQPELFEGVLEQRFADAPEWTRIRAQMDANVPAPTLLLLDWPDPPATLPLELDLVPGERADAFRRRLPSPLPGASAWESATMMLEWVRRQWEHANDHVDDPDALEVLERVDAGERFACVEYSIVLSQALNAIRIPARRLSLRQRHHHVGVGRGHVVSEAWIDDLDQWVVLDGQNSAYWVDDDDRPMSLRALQAALRAGSPARMVGLVDDMSASDSATWLTYFASVTTTALAGARGGSGGDTAGIRPRAVFGSRPTAHSRDRARSHLPRLGGHHAGLAVSARRPSGGTARRPGRPVTSRDDDFAGFVAARGKALGRTAYLLTGNHHDAEDLVQVALFKAAKVWRRRAGHPEPYVRRILYHESISGWRARLRQPAERLDREPPDVPAAEVADPATRITLQRALARLTPKQRTILVLRFYEDLSAQQTGAALGIRLGTVKSQTRHALMRLRELAPELVDFAPAEVKLSNGA